MGFFSNYFGVKKKSLVAPEERLRAVDEAIGLAAQGQLPVAEMLRWLVNGSLFVPVADPAQGPAAPGDKWNPATVTKAADGSQWLIAFTDPDLAAGFGRTNRDYASAWCVETKWVLTALPPGHGLLVNHGSAKMFEWGAEGIAHYRRDAPGGPAASGAGSG